MTDSLFLGWYRCPRLTSFKSLTFLPPAPPPPRPYVVAQATCTRRSKRAESGPQRLIAWCAGARSCGHRHGLCQLRGKEDKPGLSAWAQCTGSSGSGFRAAEFCTPFFFLAFHRVSETLSPRGSGCIMGLREANEGRGLRWKLGLAPTGRTSLPPLLTPHPNRLSRICLEGG